MQRLDFDFCPPSVHNANRKFEGQGLTSDNTTPQKERFGHLQIVSRRTEYQTIGWRKYPRQNREQSL